jgi:phytoene synthase
MAEAPALRLALAFAPAGTATLIELVWAIDAEIASSARAGIDHGVAHARLAWWHGEIERLAAGRPSHPLCRRLLALAGAAPDYAAFAARVTAAELALVGYAPAGLDELDAWFDRADGAREILAAQAIVRERQPLLTAYGRALGRGLGLAAALARNDALLLGDLERGALAARARTALQEALSALAPADRAAQRVGLVRADLALDQLDRPDRTAAPLRQLWLAWRSARRALGSAP